MREFLLGVPAKLETLLSRITATRAANLDNLDTTISSRAPSSTALSNAVWTGTKAGYLDVGITSRASQASVNLIPTSQIYAQYTLLLHDEGTLSTGSSFDTRYKDIAIGATVNTAKTTVFHGLTGSNSTSPNTYYQAGSTASYMVNARLANSTNVRIFVGTGSVSYVSGYITVIVWN